VSGDSDLEICLLQERLLHLEKVRIAAQAIVDDLEALSRSTGRSYREDLQRLDGSAPVRNIWLALLDALEGMDEWTSEISSSKSELLKAARRVRRLPKLRSPQKSPDQP
jgi:hypothetical protein